MCADDPGGSGMQRALCTFYAVVVVQDMQWHKVYRLVNAERVAPDAHAGYGIGWGDEGEERKPHG